MCQIRGVVSLKVTNSRPRSLASWRLHSAVVCTEPRSSIQHHTHVPVSKPTRTSTLNDQSGLGHHGSDGNDQTSIAGKTLPSQPSVKKQPSFGPFGATILHFRRRVCLAAHSCSGYLISVFPELGIHRFKLNPNGQGWPGAAMLTLCQRSVSIGAKKEHSPLPRTDLLVLFVTSCPCRLREGCRCRHVPSQEYQSGERRPRDQHLCLHGDGCPEALSL